MLQNTSFIKSLITLLLHFIINYSNSLPTSLNISMESVNMKHILKWSPLQASCSAVNYSVQFQGEFELHRQNGTWVDAYDCQEITENKCDLTSDLASNSDYSIRIKTKCDGQKSYAQLPATFNRRNTVLLAPSMTVTVEGKIIQVNFSKIPPDMTVNLHVWTEGDEQNVLPHEIKYPFHFSFPAKEGENMCFRANALIEAINKSCSTEKQCVFIKPKSDFDFVKPLMVIIAVVVAVVIAFFLGWSATRFGSKFKQTVCYRQPLPKALLEGWPTTPILCTEMSSESTHPLLLIQQIQSQSTRVQVDGTDQVEQSAKT